MGLTVGEAVTVWVGEEEGAKVAAGRVGRSVGDVEGEGDGSSVTVAAVGISVGPVVGPAEGAAVGAIVGLSDGQGPHDPPRLSPSWTFSIERERENWRMERKDEV